MSVVFLREGLAQDWRVKFRQADPEDIVLRLFSNEIEPDPTHTAADYDELEGGGYAPQALRGPADVEIVEQKGREIAVQTVLKVWDFTGRAEPVFGYLAVGATSGKGYWVDRFADGPYEVNGDGDQIKVSVRLT
jgi:hypothetical protein